MHKDADLLRHCGAVKNGPMEQFRHSLHMKTIFYHEGTKSTKMHKDADFVRHCAAFKNGPMEPYNYIFQFFLYFTALKIPT